ncbi:MAG: glycoside hydrolase family 30 beta sandwich domain-containing protein [Luteolibacter sp.]
MSWRMNGESHLIGWTLSQLRCSIGFAGIGMATVISWLGLIGGLPAQEVDCFVSAKNGERMALKGPLAFAEILAKHAPRFEIDENMPYQTISGFGASFLEAGMLCLNDLDANARDDVLRALFDVDSGAGFSVMKTVIGGTDFMSAGPWFTYNNHSGDGMMEHFSISRDLADEGQVAFIRSARRHGSFILQATMDYPPDWMLIDAEKNQDIDPKNFDALSRYYLRYVREYEKQGIHIDYLSPFNEPSIYTKIPWWKVRDLIKGHLGPLFEKELVRTRLMLPEAPNRRNAWENQPVVMDDAAARKYISVMPYHGYNEGGFEQIAALAKRYPDVPLWMTELCHGYVVKTPREPPLPRRDFADGDHWGNIIFSDIEAGASAWIYWNMILDEKGGPWLVSPIHGNPDENVQQPLVIIDRQTKQVTYTGAYWYLAHFGRFVRPGAVRLATSGTVKGVRCLSFRHPDGGMVAQLLNSGAAEVEVSIGLSGKSLSLSLEPNSITTCLW